MEHSQVFFLLSIGVLLAAARLFGEIARMLGFPTVLGEISAGILLGPTVLGSMFPFFWQTMFPLSGTNAEVLNGFVAISLALFLLSSGMEVDLSNVFKQGRTAFFISFTGIIVPFVIGFGIAGAFPSFFGMGHHQPQSVFQLFIAVALSISALPVIAKTLMDLNLYRTDLGMIVMPAAIIQDVVGWCVFALILSMIGVNPRFSVFETVLLTLVFAVTMLTVIRKLLDKLLPFIQAHWSWPGGIIGIGISLALISASFTEWIGIHALFGAFFCGIALGDSKHMSEKTRFAFETFISNFFAPLFFASIGLKINFVMHFDLPLVIVIIAVATIGKVGGSLLGGKLSRMSRRDSLAVGYAMNARGAMEIILGVVALHYKDLCRVGNYGLGYLTHERSHDQTSASPDRT